MIFVSESLEWVKLKRVCGLFQNRTIISISYLISVNRPRFILDPEGPTDPSETSFLTMSDSESSCKPHRVAYIWSEELQHVADQLPSNIGRSTVVHDLIKSLDLLDIVGDDNQCHVSEYGYGAKENHGPIGRRARVVEPDVERFGRREHLERYHDKKYVGWSLHLDTYAVC